MKIVSRSLACCILYFLLQMSAYAAESLTFQVSGLSDPLLENVNARLSLFKKNYNDQLTIDDVQIIYNQSVQEIRKALEPYGYFKANITASLHHQKQVWTASFQVNPGPVLKITKIDIEILGDGSNNKALYSFKNEFPLQVGDPFKTANYEKAKEDIFAVANNQGYIKSFLEKNAIYINLQKYEASIVLHLQTGPRYYFGAVNFSGSPYAESFLRRFVNFNENEPFSSQKLTALQQQLAGSYYFSQVQVVPEFEQAHDYHVPVKFILAAPKSQHYNIGVGYGSLTGPRLTAGLNLRRVTDTGQHFDAQLKLSSVLSSMTAKYYIPGKHPLTDQWVMGLNYQKFNPASGSSSSATLSGGYLKKKHAYQISSNINYLVENYKLAGEPGEKNNLLYPNLSILYSNVDDLIHTRNGKSFNLILQGATNHLFSSTSFLQSEFKAKYLFSPTQDSHVILRADLGYTVVHDIHKLPLSMRFFAGGLNSVRGYKDSGIGPGRYLATGTVELQHHITGNWSGALFYDMGTATDHWDNQFSKSTGVGVIYESMIGPIKLYAAHALDRPGRPYSVEFSIGPEF